MKHIHSTAFILLTVLLFSCGSDPSKSTTKDTDAPTGEVMYQRIMAMEDSIFDKTEFDKHGIQALHDVYLAFVRKYPTDTICPDLLFRAAGASKALGRPEKSIEMYDRIIQDHPSWPRIVDAYYLRAFTFDNDLKRMGAAREAYQLVIEKFPGHRFAQDSQTMIENLGLSDEELIKKFEERNKNTGS